MPTVPTILSALATLAAFAKLPALRAAGVTEARNFGVAKDIVVDFLDPVRVDVARPPFTFFAAFVLLAPFAFFVSTTFARLLAFGLMSAVYLCTKQTKKKKKK